jgi:hypothetical protein
MHVHGKSNLLRMAEGSRSRQSLAEPSAASTYYGNTWE